MNSAICDRIVVEAPHIVSVRLASAVYEHTLALPDAVMARPTGVGTR